MPKTRLMASLHKPNQLAAELKAHKDTSNLSDGEIADQMNISRENVNRKINQPVGNWKLKDLISICKILSVTPSEAFEAILKSI